MKKSFFIVMLIANLIPQETFGSDSAGRLERLRNAEAIRETAEQELAAIHEDWPKLGFTMPLTDRDYSNAHRILTVRLVTAVGRSHPTVPTPEAALADNAHLFLREKQDDFLKEKKMAEAAAAAIARASQQSAPRAGSYLAQIFGWFWK